ncbi:ORMDL family protein [Endogone sp. FLAS-F59071]|nr:ORMDL family protein [Endogone sp. FLAS-F59071]|eukprot:RUS13033.1 ORMDL family protein [Endogone sp. FLAS-F59071]
MSYNSNYTNTATRPHYPRYAPASQFNSMSSIVTEEEHKTQIYNQSLDQSSMVNLNSSWVNYKGAWVTTVFLIVCLKMFFSIIPGISPEASWTLTNLSFNFVSLRFFSFLSMVIGSFIMFHWVQGIPFENNQGAYDGLTLWEQIDGGIQFTATRKFLTAVPILLFLLSTHYTHYDFFTFGINFTALVVVLVAKLPLMHRVRVFGINKIDTD